MKKNIIKPFHMFHHQGRWHVINIEGMFAITIDDVVAGVLGTIAAQNAPLESHIEEQLRKLGLLAADGEGTLKVKKDIKKEPHPVVNMCLFLTQSCNLKCVYCYGDGGGYGTGGSMDKKTAFQAVDWLLEQSGKIKKLHIGFFGGEPFLNFPLMKVIVAYAKNRVEEMGKAVDFNTTTNATLLDDEQIAFIKEHKINALISLDGPKEVHDAQRPYTNGEGSYDVIVPKIKKLLAVMPETPGHAVIVGMTDPNIVKKALQAIGFAEISIMPASNSLFTKDRDTTNGLRDTERFLQTLEGEAEAWLRLAKNRDKEALQKLKAKSGLYQGMISLLHNKKKRHACGAGLGLAGVSSAGDIYLCHRFVGMDEYKVGSVFAKDLDREAYQKSPVTESQVCSICFAKYYCAGGCKHDNVGSCGSITTPSEDICQLKRREFELAATVICQLDSEDKAFLVEYGIFTPKPCPFDF